MHEVRISGIDADTGRMGAMRLLNSERLACRENGSRETLLLWLSDLANSVVSQNILQ